MLLVITPHDFCGVTVFVELAMAHTAPTEFLVKHLDEPDETKTFDHGKLDIANLGPVKIKRATLEPGWRWSESIGANIGKASCPQAHLVYVVSGRVTVEMDDGPRETLEPGDVASVPPGHDGWVEGDETTVYIEFEA